MIYHIHTLEDPDLVAAEAQRIESILAQLAELHAGVKGPVGFEVGMATPTHGVAVFGVIADGGMGALCVEVATVEPDGSAATLAASVALTNKKGE